MKVLLITIDSIKGKSTMKTHQQTCLISNIQQNRTLFRSVGWILCGVMVLPIAPVFGADLQIDGSAALFNQADIDTAANGVPLINIVEANENGISHNKFSDYNVGTEGLILNNSTSDIDSLLGGAIRANENLNGTSASLILNEVTSTNRSLLEGFQEVAGQAADLVIVNPNGISCNGCGFINTPQATLTTGLPQFIGGALAGFQVLGGDISIGNIGLDASDTQRFNLVTRSLVIDGEVYANDLGIFTGSSDYDYNQRSASALSTGTTSPGYLVDSSALGGVYANRILLLGNEAGVGVRIRGDMAASTDDLIINTSGLIELTDSAKLFAGQNISIDNQGHNLVAENGYLYSVADLNIDVSNLQSNNFNFYSDGDTNLNAANWNQVGGEIDSTGALTFNLQETASFDGAKIISGADLDFNGQSLSLVNNTRMGSGGDLIANASEVISLENSLLSTGSSATITTDLLTLTTDQGDSVTGLRSQGALTLNSGVVSGNDQIVSQDDITINSDDVFDNDATINSSGNLQINSSSIVNNGKLLSGAQITSTATEVNNEDGAIIAANSTITLGDGSGELNNRGSAVISAENGAALNLDFSTVDNEGTLNANGELHITTGVLENSGTVYTSALLDIQTGTLSNGENALIGGDGVGVGQIIGLGGLLENNGDITYGGDLEISGFSNILNSTLIATQGGLSINTPLFDQIGKVHSDGTLGVYLPDDQLFTVSSGDILSGLAGLRFEGGGMIIEENAALKSNGQINIGETQSLSTFANSGRILGGSVRLNAVEAENELLGVIDGSNGNVVIRTDQLVNRGGIFSSDTVSVGYRYTYLEPPTHPHPSVLNNYGDIYSSGTVSIGGGVENWGVINAWSNIRMSNPNAGIGVISDVINHEDGYIFSKYGKLTIGGHSTSGIDRNMRLINRGFMGGNTIDLSLTDLYNYGEFLSSKQNGNSQDSQISSNTIHNYGTLFTNHRIYILANQVSNYEAAEFVFNSDLDMRLEGGSLLNHGLFSVEEILNVTLVGGSFENTGVFQSGLNNQDSYDTTMFLRLDEQDGSVGDFENGVGGKIFSNGIFRFLGGTTVTNSGDIRSNSSISMSHNTAIPSGVEFENTSEGTISAVAGIGITSVGELSNDGEILSGGSISLDSWGSLTNRGSIWGNGSVQLEISYSDGVILNTAGATIESQAWVVFSTGSFVNETATIDFVNYGKIFAGATGLFERSRNNVSTFFINNGQLAAGARIIVEVDEFRNSNGGTLQSPRIDITADTVINDGATTTGVGTTDNTPGEGSGDDVQANAEDEGYTPESISSSPEGSPDLGSAPASGSIPGVEIVLPEQGSGGLFVQSNPSNGYLIETRPEFGLAYLSSQWLLDLIADDPVVNDPIIDIPVVDQPVVDDPVPVVDPMAVTDENIQSASNSAEQTLRVGDGYYETILVRDQITELTDQRYIYDGVSDDSLQYQILLQNAAKNYKALDLKLGIALSAEQVSNLAQDIVWMVEVEVDGKKALAPRVYLTEETLSSIAGGAKILGDSINIAGRSVIENSGTIRGGNVSLASQGVTENSGTIQGDKVNVVSQGRTENTGTINGGNVNVSSMTTMTNRGLIEGRSVKVNGREVSENYGTIRGEEYAGLGGAKMIQREGSVLESLNGEVGFVGHEYIREEGAELNTDKIYLGLSSDWENQGEFSGKKSIRGYVKNLINTGKTLEAGQIDLSANNINNKGGKIIATEGKVNLESKSGIDNTKGTIDAMGDVSLHAEDDITNKAGNIVGDNVSLVSTDGDIVNSAGDKIRIGNKKNYTEVQGKRGNITARSNLEMDAGGDIINAASDITAGGNAKLNAGGDVIFSAEVLESKKTTRKTSGFVVNQKTTTTTTTTKNTVGSTLTVGGDLDLDSGGNATFTAAKVKVGGKANIDVEGDFELLSGQNSTETKTYSRESGIGVGGGIGGSETVDETDFVGTNIATTFEVGAGESNITTGGNLVLQGSDLTTKGRTTISVGGDLNVLDGLDESSNYKTTTTTTYFAGDNDGGGESNTGSESDPDALRARGNASAESETGAKNDLKLWKETITTVDTNKTTSVASNLVVGGGSEITSGATINLRGSNIHADGAATINAKNLNVTAGRNEEWTDTTIKETSVGFYTEAAAEAGAEVEGQASARGAQATNVRGGGAANAEASATLTMGAQYKKETEFTSNVNHSLSSITSDGPLTINVDKKATFKGADVTSGNDLTINAGDIENRSVKDIVIHNTSSSSHTGGLYVGGSASADTNTQVQGEAVGAQDAHYQAEVSAQADAGLRYKFEGESVDDKTTTHVGNTFRAGGNLTRNASNTITDQATDLKAGGSIIQDAKEITELAATNTHVVTHYEEEHEVRVGAYAGGGAEAEGEAGGSYLNPDGYNEPSNEGDADASHGFSAKYEGNREDSKTTTKTAAVTKYEAGEDIISTSSGATTLIGTQMTAGNDIELNAQSLTVNAADEGIVHTKTTHEGGAEIVVAKKQGGKGKKKAGINLEYEYGDLEENTDTVVVGNFTAGGGVAMNTEENLTLVGTDIEAGGPVSIDAGSVDFKAAKEHEDSTENNVEASLDYGQEVSGDNAKGARGEFEHGEEIEDTNNVVSIRSGTGGTSITSRSDITMEGSDLDSTGATNIQAEGKVDLKAEKNTSSSMDIGVQAGIDPEHEEGESKIKGRIGGNYNDEETTSFDRTSINSTGDITISGSNITNQDASVTSTEGNVTYEGDVTEKAANDENSSIDIEIHTGNLESKSKN